MKKCYLMIMALIVCFFTVSSTVFQSKKGNVSSLDLHGRNGRNQPQVKIDNDYGKMPLYFIPNQGQMDK